MRGFLFLAPVFLLPFAGNGFLTVRFRHEKPLAAVIAAAAGIGAVVVTAEMLALSLLEVRWSFLVLLGLPILFSTGKVLVEAPRAPASSREKDANARAGLFGATAVLLLVAYAAATARATSSDLLLFWGTKGERFGIARGVDVPLLRAPENFPMHIDYPPLLPFLSALGTMLAGRFAWGASLLYLPIFLSLATAAFWGVGRDRLGPSRAGALTALFAALFGYALTDSLCAGNAEAPLLFFETLSLSLLLLTDDSPSDEFVAGLSLAGVAITKFEGALFVTATIAGVVVFLRRGRARIGTFLRLSMFPAILLAAWILFCRVQGIRDSYAGGVQSGPFVPKHFVPAITAVIRSAGYDAFFLPWFAVGAVLVVSKKSRTMIAPAAIGLFHLGGILFIYLHGNDDPSRWIGWSAPRLLLTPLLCLFFMLATAATDTIAMGRSPESTRNREDRT
jgi:hypothetical protein